MIYLDSAAVVKLVRQEVGSADLVSWLNTVLSNESGAALVAFVSYDRRLLDCAKAVGLPVASPGQD